VHSVQAPEDTVVLIRVSPADDAFDPVIGVSADPSTADRLTEFFATDGPLPDDVFSGVVPEDTRLLGVADATGPGEDEFTYVATPFGGDMEVLVTGAGMTVGEFELEVTLQPFDGPDDGRAYIGELEGQAFLDDYEQPRSPIEDVLDDFTEDGD
jgi:hypothetical protein